MVLEKYSFKGIFNDTLPYRVHTFIAEEASPVPLTIALPGIAAGPMNTTRIKHTIVTELALPAIPTPIGQRGQKQNRKSFHITNS